MRFFMTVVFRICLPLSVLIGSFSFAGEDITKFENQQFSSCMKSASQTSTDPIRKDHLYAKCFDTFKGKVSMQDCIKATKGTKYLITHDFIYNQVVSQCLRSRINIDTFQSCTNLSERLPDPIGKDHLQLLCLKKHFFQGLSTEQCEEFATWKITHGPYHEAALNLCKNQLSAEDATLLQTIK